MPRQPSNKQLSHWLRGHKFLGTDNLPHLRLRFSRYLREQELFIDVIGITVFNALARWRWQKRYGCNTLMCWGHYNNTVTIFNRWGDGLGKRKITTNNACFWDWNKTGMNCPWAFIIIQSRLRAGRNPWKVLFHWNDETMKATLTYFVLTGFANGHPFICPADPIYAQYLTNPLTINPAYAGINNQFTAPFNTARNGRRGCQPAHLISAANIVHCSK